MGHCGKKRPFRPHTHICTHVCANTCTHTCTPAILGAVALTHKTLWHSPAAPHPQVTWTKLLGSGCSIGLPKTPKLATSTPTDPALLSSLPISKSLGSSAPGGQAGCPTARLGLRSEGIRVEGHLLGQGTRKPHGGNHTSSPRASHASSLGAGPRPQNLPKSPGPAGHCTPHHWAEDRAGGKRGGGEEQSARAISPPAMDWEKVVPGF